MVFIVLRHGQSIFNKDNILAGWTDVVLSEKGRREALEAATKLNHLGIKFDKIFSSDLKRAIETRDIISRKLNQDSSFFIESSMLKERNYGILQEKNIDYIIQTVGEKKFFEWRKSYYGCPPEGESLHQVKKRVGNYYDKNILPLIKYDKHVLLVSHSNSIRALFVHLGLQSKKSIEYFEISNSQPIMIDIYNKKFELL